MTEYAYVRIDGSREYIGVDTCMGTAYEISLMIESILEETGGWSPVSIEATFRADAAALQFDAVVRLEYPIALNDLRATFLAVEDSVGSGSESFPRVTRAIRYEPVVLDEPGDSVVLHVEVPTGPDWDPARMCGVVFVQQTTGSKTIVQTAIAQNAVSGVAGDGGSTPSFGIRAVEPNPFNDAAVIRFEIPAGVGAHPIDLAVFDAAGRRVRTLRTGRLESGPHRLRWDGRSDGGDRVDSGVYFVRLQTAAGIAGRKVIALTR